MKYNDMGSYFTSIESKTCGLGEKNCAFRITTSYFKGVKLVTPYLHLCGCVPGRVQEQAQSAQPRSLGRVVQSPVKLSQG